MTDKRVPPGPTGLAKLTAMPRFLNDPFTFMASCVERYGDVFRLPFGPGGTTVVNDPEHVKVWLTDNENFPKGLMAHSLAPVFGESLPISEGEKWRRHRKFDQTRCSAASRSAVSPR